jgi:hypothetical protein
MVTLDIDLSSPGADDGHVFVVTVTQDNDFTFSNYPSDKESFVWIVVVKQNATGNHAITWPSEVVNPPTVSTTADTTSIVQFFTWDNGTTVYAVPTVNAQPGSQTTTLDALTDTDINSLTDDDVLAYDQPSGKWTNQSATEAGLVSNPMSASLGVDADAAYDIASDSFRIGNVWASSVNVGDSSDNYILSGNPTRGEINYGGNEFRLESATGTALNVTNSVVDSVKPFVLSDEMRVSPITKPASLTTAKIYTENLANDDLVLNGPTGGGVRVDIAGQEIFDVKSGESQVTGVSGTHNFNFFRDDPTPLDNDEISNITWIGNSWTGSALGIPFNFARIVVTQPTVLDSAADGKIDFKVLDNSVLTSKLSLDPAGIDAHSNRILNVSTPTAGTDAVNKTYVDSIVAFDPLDIDSDLIPDVDSTRNIGSSGKYWATGFIDKVNFTDTDHNITKNGSDLRYTTVASSRHDWIVGLNQEMFLDSTGLTIKDSLDVEDNVTLGSAATDNLIINAQLESALAVATTVGNDKVGEIRGTDDTPDIFELKLETNIDYKLLANTTTKQHFDASANEMLFDGCQTLRSAERLNIPEVSANPPTPSSGLVTIFAVNSGGTNEVRAINSNGDVITLGAFP